MNRRQITAHFVTCWLLVVVAFPSALTRAEDWPRWRGVRADGTWNAPKLAETWPSDGIPVVWKRPIGGGYAGIIVVGNRLFTMDRVGVEPKAFDPVKSLPKSETPKSDDKKSPEMERVVALDADTGKPLWTHAYEVNYGTLDYGNGPRAAPTFHEGRIYTLGALGHFCCLDAATGKVHWQYDLATTEKAKMPTWGYAASPVIWKHLVLVHVGAQDGGCLLAYDRLSGKLVWRGGGDPAGYATPVLINAPSGEQVLAWTPENIVGLAPADGKTLWKIPYKITYGVSIATPIYQDGLVLVAGYWDGSKAIRLGKEPTDATLEWEDTRLLRGLMSPPLYKDGHVYLLDKGNGLTCFEMATGKKVWDDGHKLTARGRNPHASLVWINDGDRALALNEAGELVQLRLNPRGYQETDRKKIIGPTWAHPAYAGKRCYARSDSEIVAVQLAAE